MTGDTVNPNVHKLPDSLAGLCVNDIRNDTAPALTLDGMIPVDEE